LFKRTILRIYIYTPALETQSLVSPIKTILAAHNRESANV